MIKGNSHQIHLFRDQKEISCKADESILEATLAAGVNHTHACGGQGKCSTCRVSIISGIENCTPRNELEKEIDRRLNLPPEIRLACQTKLTGDVSIRRMVSDKIDSELIAEQFSSDSRIALGRQQQLTIVFIDIVNYTAFAEKFPPYDIVHVLNRYYRMMNQMIQAHHGIISDVAGDGILAVFGTDESCKNSVQDAMDAIKGMKESLVSFNLYLKENFNIEFGFRAGVHYGNVIVGPFDTGSMKKLAVIGDNVNYASRIEAANKTFGTKVLLSADAYEMIASNYTQKNVFEATLKGKTGTYKLYELELAE